MKWIKENWFRVGALIVILIVGLGAAYVVYQMFVVAPYARQLQAQEFQAKQQEAFSRQQATQKTTQDNAASIAESLYTYCLSQAQQTYESSIRAACSGASGCTMPIAQGQAEDDRLKSDKTICEEHYQASLQAAYKQ